MSKYWSRTAQRIEPYVPGEQPQVKQFIKLNTNESPYPPSPQAIKALQAAITDKLRLYPDPNCTELHQAIAEYYGLEPDQVFAGNGSDETLAFAFQAFFDPGKPVLFPEITYSFYPVYASLYGLDYRTVPQDEEFCISLEALCTGEAGGIILANPNSPTGICLPLSAIEEVIRSNPQCVVIIDEAYIDFGGESAVPLIAEYPNLIVMQTFSKSRCLAGLRVGFALGRPQLLTALMRIKNSFNSYTLDRLAQIGACAAIGDREYFEETRAKIIKTRSELIPALENLGFKVCESRANFLFISHPSVPAISLLRQLKERGILVRHYQQPPIENYLRVTIGTAEEMEQFITAVSAIVSGESRNA